MNPQLDEWFKRTCQEDDMLIRLAEHLVARIKDKVFTDKSFSLDAARAAVEIIEKEFLQKAKTLTGKVQQSGTNKDYK